jgi:hypothetical protein
MLALATVLVGGGVAASVVVKSFSVYMMDLARGYQFHPSSTSGFEDLDLSISTEILLGLVWVASSVLVAACLVYRDGHFRNLNFFSLFRSGLHCRPFLRYGERPPISQDPPHHRLSVTLPSAPLMPIMFLNPLTCHRDSPNMPTWYTRRAKIQETFLVFKIPPYATRRNTC